MGNVLATVQDRKSGYGNVGGLYAKFNANVSSLTDYYPFGMMIDGRSVEHSFYRFSHNTQERSDEIADKGNHHTALFWEYSPRIARRWSVDPVDQISISNYAVFANNSIMYNDVLGDQATGFDARANAMHRMAAEGKISQEQLLKFYKDNGVAGVIGGAIVLDIFVTKGRVSQFLFTAVPAASLIEHNKSKTPEQQKLQQERFNENLTNLAVGYGVSKAVGVLTKVALSTGRTVYKTFQSFSIRFSQSLVKGSDYEAIKTLMKSGKSFEPLDIVKMEDGIYTSLDNKRLMAAQELGKDIKATAHNFDDILDDATKARILDKHKVEVNTWGEAIQARTKGQAKYISRDSPNGSFVKPKVSGN